MLTVNKLAQKMAGVFGYELARKPSENSRHCWPVRSRTPQTSFENDSWFHSLYERAQVKTQMESTDNALRRQRHYTLNQLLKRIDGLDGDVAEIGCWRGLSAYQTASRIVDMGASRRFHIFDSFQGLSEYEAIDMPHNGNIDVASTRVQFACSQDQVQQNLSDFDFIVYHPGWVPEKFSEVDADKFAFAHIDVDLYLPTKDCFDFFYPRLVEGGVMVFDDYGSTAFPGAQQAVDEAIARLDHPFFMSLPSGQAFLVKTS